MSVQIYELAATGGLTASGYWTTNTNRFNDAILRHVFIDFEKTPTTFEFRLIDNKDRVLINLTTCSTIMNRNYSLPLRGIYTLMISNATVDTGFKLRFAAQDVY